MKLRPWHVMISVIALAIGLIAGAFFAEERAKDILLGVGTNLISSVVFFILLELYWRQMKRANGKEVDGFDYFKLARNIRKSKSTRMLSTYILPFTRHPKHLEERKILLQAIAEALARKRFAGMQLLLLHPASPAAKARAAERQDDDVMKRMDESLQTLAEIAAEFAGDGRVEIRLYWRTPPFSLFQTDNFASLSFYFRDRPISEVARYEFFTDSPVGEFVEKTFDDLWRDERTVTLAECQRQWAALAAETEHGVA